MADNAPTPHPLLAFAKYAFPLPLWTGECGGRLQRSVLVSLTPDLEKCLLYNPETMRFRIECAITTTCALVHDDEGAGFGFVPGNEGGYIGLMPHEKDPEKWSAVAEGITLGPFDSQLAAAMAFDEAMIFVSPTRTYARNFGGRAGFMAGGEAAKKLSKGDAAKLKAEVWRVAKLSVARLHAEVPGGSRKGCAKRVSRPRFGRKA